MGTSGAGALERGWRIAAWGGAAALLLTPLIAMQFTAEIEWDVRDFALVGFMLLAACTAFELMARRGQGFAYRAASAVAVGGGFLLVFANAAVGFIGDGGHPANLLFAAMLLIGAALAVAGRFRAAAMARALFAVAAMQVAILGLVLATGWGDAAPQWPLDVVKGTGFFTIVWLVAAFLYRVAAARAEAAPR